PYPQITAIHAALWDSDGEVRIEPAADSGEWGFAATKGKGVRSVTVETLMREFGLPSIDIFKMDIEGAECEIFSRICNWIKSVRCFMIETHDRLRPGSSDTVRTALGRMRSFDKGEITVFISRIRLTS